MTSTIEVAERGRPIAFSCEDMLRYHGPGSPGGVAHAFKVLERALPLLDPDGLCERREIVEETASRPAGEVYDVSEPEPARSRR